MEDHDLEPRIEDRLKRLDSSIKETDALIEHNAEVVEQSAHCSRKTRDILNSAAARLRKSVASQRQRGSGDPGSISQ